MIWVVLTIIEAVACICLYIALEAAWFMNNKFKIELRKEKHVVAQLQSKVRDLRACLDTRDHNG